MKFSKHYEIKDELDKVSPSFCIAKWKQVTIHLEKGLTHSCHHPRVHQIPLEEIKNNPSALHNTKYKKLIRKDMLEGKFINECEFCNNITKDNVNELSDRVFKSSDDWALPFLQEIKDNGWEYDSFPSYLEVSFSSACNSKCIYCSPNFSTQWQKEIKKYGPYKIASYDNSALELSKYTSTDNPYIKAFWEWWPDLYHHLHTFRITGGEPLLHDDTFKIMKYMIDKPRANLNFAVNSNFSVNEKIFRSFIELSKKLVVNSPRFTAFTSCEATGKRADYIRQGLDYDKWIENCYTFLEEVPGTMLSIMAAYNVLSITSFTDFLKDILKMKEAYPNRVKIDTPYLNNPSHLNPNIILKDFIPFVQESLAFVEGNNNFNKWEVIKIQSIYNVLKNVKETPQIIKNRIYFKEYIIEHDRRNGTDFKSVFPEYIEFMKSIESK